LKKLISALLVLSILTACDSTIQTISVEHHGVLREIMREQKLDVNADLLDYESVSNLYALGALEGLSGEILILDGKPLHSYANEGSLVIDRSFNWKATLLVTSQVTAWESFKIDAIINENSDLQALVFKEAQRLGINADEAFPFMLKGSIDSIEWHVINAKEATAQNHDAYKAAGLKGTGQYKDARVLGFYSNQHEGIFTHHGSYLHMHFINEEESVMGHVDALKNDGSLSLWLPKMKSK